MTYKEKIKKIKLLDGVKLKEIAEKIINLSLDDREEFLATLLLCERWKCSNEIFEKKQRVEIEYEYMKSFDFEKDKLNEVITASQSLIQDYSSQLVLESNADKSIMEWKELGLNCSSIKKLQGA